MRQAGRLDPHPCLFLLLSTPHAKSLASLPAAMAGVWPELHGGLAAVLPRFSAGPSAAARGSLQCLCEAAERWHKLAATRALEEAPPPVGVERAELLRGTVPVSAKRLPAFTAPPHSNASVTPFCQHMPSAGPVCLDHCLVSSAPSLSSHAAC
ncbi:hypothetical protein ABPG75_000191 [Micractinium tetrahymenae]